MPTQYIPVSEQEQHFARLIERIFNDPAFAKSMQTNPSEALEEAGYHLTPEQIKSIGESEPITDGENIKISIVKPVVNVITKGTKPVVTIVTKGTQPVVHVATNTVIVKSSEAGELAPSDKVLTAEEVCQGEGD